MTWTHSDRAEVVIPTSLGVFQIFGMGLFLAAVGLGFLGITRWRKTK